MHAPVNTTDIRKNGEGYFDPTACAAIRNADADYDRLSKVIREIKELCASSGFRLEERIVLRDTKTGKIWR